MKTLLVTKSYPPVVGGSAFLLYELTRHFQKDELVVIHGINEPPIYSKQNLPFKRVQVLFMGNGQNTQRLNRYFPKLYIWLIRKTIRKVIKKDKIDRIYIHYPNGAFTVAAFKEARRANLPYVFYQDILWEEGRLGAELKLAQKFEKAVIENASARIAITELASEHQEKKHGKSFNTIPHTLDEDNIPEAFKEVNNTTPKIHFAGGIYPNMNQDSVLRMVKAAKSLNRPLEFEFCSPEVTPELKQEKINWRFLNKEELLQTQSTSDILYLPQAFKSKMHTVIKYNFPTKTMEYLCSGRPILVHSPKDSYLSYLCRTEKFGYLVEDMDENSLADGISAILENVDLQKELVNNALDLAKRRKSSEWFLMLKNLLNSI